MRSIWAALFLLALASPACAQDDQISNTTVKFFEGGWTTPEKKARIYAAQFEKSKTRYVYTELSGENGLYRKRKQKLDLSYKYFKADGTAFGTGSNSMELPPEWPGFSTADEIGWTRAGRWTGGVYRVEVFLNGTKKLAEGTFTIIDDVANRPPLAQTPQENVKIARQRYAIEDVAGAMIFCQGALDQDPAFVEAYEARADFHFNQGSLEEAIADASKAIECGPARSQGYHTRARSHAAKFDYETALQDYSKAIELEPTKALYYRNRGLAKYSLQDYEGSLADVERCITLDPASADGFNDRGFLRQRVGDFTGAVEDYGRALKIDADHASALFNRGTVHLKRGARYQARLDFEAAIRNGGDATRARAAESLGEVGLTDGAGVLAGLLWDDDETVRRKAVWSMGRLKGRVHAADIARLLRDRVADVRAAAAIAIGEVGGKEHTDALEALLTQNDAVARVHALFSLCRLGITRHSDLARKLLADSDAHVRGDAIEAVGFLGDKQWAKEIVPHLKDADADIRLKAIASLGRMGAQEQSADIAALLDDPAMGRLYNEEKADWKHAIVSELAARTLLGWGLDPDAMRPKRTPAAPRPIAGTYGLIREQDPEAKSQGDLKIGAVREDGRFDVEGKDWKGKGVIDGDRGYYDWRFLDGSTGRTTFTVDAEGRLHGRVVGVNIDWKYLGTKK
jgi:tetratricopeptide (TPR) repeat protein